MCNPSTFDYLASLTISTRALAAGLQFDLPYGLLTKENSGVEWDVPLTRDELSTVLRQFEAIQEAQSWYASFNCDVSQAGLIMDVLQVHHPPFLAQDGANSERHPPPVHASG